MDIPENAVGTYNADGSVKTDATADLISGLSVRGQHATTHGIPGTRKFVRILAENYHYFTEEFRAALFKELGAAPAPQPQTEPEPSPASEVSSRPDTTADESAKES